MATAQPPPPPPPFYKRTYGKQSESLQTVTNPKPISQKQQGRKGPCVGHHRWLIQDVQMWFHIDFQDNK